MENTGIDVEHEPGPGLIYVILDERERSYLDRILENFDGDGSVRWMDPSELLEIEPRLSDEIVGGALIQGEYQINPMILAEAYKRAALALGGRFLNTTLVDNLVREEDRVVGVRLQDDTVVTAATTINAAGAWSGQLAKSVGIPLPVEPVRGQIVLTEALPRVLNACLSTSACHVVQKRHGEVLIGSTTEHVGFDASETREGIACLCCGATRVMPMLQHVGIKRVWAGLRPGSPDELPILGPVACIEVYLNASGLFRTGIVAAPLASKILAEVHCQQ